MAASTEPTLIGRSQALVRLLDRVDAVARAGVAVVVRGEPGAGKKLVGRLLHARSNRSQGPFITFDCEAIPSELAHAELVGRLVGGALQPGRLQEAHGGTLLLDQVHKLSLESQQHLLHALQERQVVPLGTTTPVAIDTQIVSATSRNLRELVEAGRFLEDLFYRLKVVELQVPPLRERESDIHLLMEHFARAEGAWPLRMTPEARGILHRWPYPQNVRELELAIRQSAAVANGDVIDVHHLPDAMRPGMADPEQADGSLSLAEAVRRFERRHLIQALRKYDGNRSKTAAGLGISRKNLWEKMKSHGITDEEYSESNPPREQTQSADDPPPRA